jgi:hypothetical protein
MNKPWSDQNIVVILFQMGKLKKYKGFYLMITFAIFWVSFASIIQFHISKIHGNDFARTIEFVKTLDHQNLKKDTKVCFKTNFNSSSWIVDESTVFTHFFQYSKAFVRNISEQPMLICLETPTLRGPPAI